MTQDEYRKAESLRRLREPVSEILVGTLSAMTSASIRKQIHNAGSTLHDHGYLVTCTSPAFLRPDDILYLIEHREA